MLEQAITEVYLPLLCNFDFNSQGPSTQDKKDSTINKVNKSDDAKSEFIILMQKFASQINTTVSQIAGETRLKIPDEVLNMQLNKDNEPNDPSVIEALEGLAEEWIVTIVGALAKEAKKVPNGNVSGNEFKENYNLLISRALSLKSIFGVISVHLFQHYMNN